VDFDAGAGKRATREMGLFGFHEVYGAIDGSVDSVIAGLESAGTGDFGVAGLADDDFASLDGLTAKAFNAKALACIVMNIFGGAAGFDM